MGLESNSGVIFLPAPVHTVRDRNNRNFRVYFCLWTLSSYVQSATIPAQAAFLLLLFILLKYINVQHCNYGSTMSALFFSQYLPFTRYEYLSTRLRIDKIDYCLCTDLVSGDPSRSNAFHVLISFFAGLLFSSWTIGSAMSVEYLVRVPLTRYSWKSLHLETCISCHGPVLPSLLKCCRLVAIQWWRLVCWSHVA